MTDFQTIRTEARNEIKAIHAAKVGKLTTEQLHRVKYLANVVTHSDIAVARERGGKEWKRYERGTGHDTTQPYQSQEAWAAAWGLN